MDIHCSTLDDENSRKSHNPRGNVVPFKEIFDNTLPIKVDQLQISDMKEEISVDTSDTIQFFSLKDEYAYLSNFSKHSFNLNNIHWKTAQHYIQSKKFVGTPLGNNKIIQKKRFYNNSL